MQSREEILIRMRLLRAELSGLSQALRELEEAERLVYTEELHTETAATKERRDAAQKAHDEAVSRRGVQRFDG